MPSDQTLTLADLDQWSYEGTALAVLGHPIKHSLSPAMHNAALSVMAGRDPRFARWQYFKFDVDPADLPLALERFRAKGFLGLNLTVPHKVLAFSQVHDVDSAAQPIGAINTLVAGEKEWRGFNTDGHGLAAGILEDLRLPLAGADIVLLGAGGAARGAAVECLQRGCRSLWIANRTAANLEALLKDLKPLAGGSLLRGFAPTQPPGDLPSQALVINTTSAGLHENDAVPIDLSALPKPSAVYDAIYNPPRTKLLLQAETLGIPNANGLSMLVHQGAQALALWTKSEVPVDAMRSAARLALGR